MEKKIYEDCMLNLRSTHANEGKQSCDREKEMRSEKHKDNWSCWRNQGKNIVEAVVGPPLFTLT